MSSSPASKSRSEVLRSGAGATSIGIEEGSAARGHDVPRQDEARRRETSARKAPVPSGAVGSKRRGRRAQSGDARARARCIGSMAPKTAASGSPFVERGLGTSARRAAAPRARARSTEKIEVARVERGEARGAQALAEADDRLARPPAWACRRRARGRARWWRRRRRRGRRRPRRRGRPSGRGGRAGRARPWARGRGTRRCRRAGVRPMAAARGGPASRAAASAPRPARKRRRPWFTAPPRARRRSRPRRARAPARPAGRRRSRVRPAGAGMRAHLVQARGGAGAERDGRGARPRADHDRVVERARRVEAGEDLGLAVLVQIADGELRAHARRAPSGGRRRRAPRARRPRGRPRPCRARRAGRGGAAEAKASYLPPTLAARGAASPARQGPRGPVTVSSWMRVHAEAAPSGTARPGERREGAQRAVEAHAPGAVGEPDVDERGAAGRGDDGREADGLAQRRGRDGGEVRPGAGAEDLDAAAAEPEGAHPAPAHRDDLGRAVLVDVPARERDHVALEVPGALHVGRDERQRREVGPHLGVDGRLGERVRDGAGLGVLDARPDVARHRVDVGGGAELAGADLHRQVDEHALSARGLPRRGERQRLGARVGGRAAAAGDLGGERAHERCAARRGRVARERRGGDQRARGGAGERLGEGVRDARDGGARLRRRLRRGGGGRGDERTEGRARRQVIESVPPLRHVSPRPRLQRTVQAYIQNAETRAHGERRREGPVEARPRPARRFDQNPPPSARRARGARRGARR